MHTQKSVGSREADLVIQGLDRLPKHFHMFAKVRRMM